MSSLAVYRRGPMHVASLRTYLVAVILLATVPLALLMSYQIVDGIRSQQTRLGVDLQRSAMVLSQTVDRELKSMADALMSVRPASAAAGDRMSAAVHEQLRQLLRQHPDWSGVFALDGGGNWLFDTSATADLARGQASRLLEGTENGGLPGGPRVSGLIVDTLQRPHRTAVAVRLPNRARTPWLWARGFPWRLGRKCCGYPRRLPTGLSALSTATTVSSPARCCQFRRSGNGCQAAR